MDCREAYHGRLALTALRSRSLRSLRLVRLVCAILISWKGRAVARWGTRRWLVYKDNGEIPGISRFAQNDGVKHATAKANAGILRFAQNDKLLVLEGEPFGFRRMFFNGRVRWGCGVGGRCR